MKEMLHNEYGFQDDGKAEVRASIKVYEDFLRAFERAKLTFPVNPVYITTNPPQTNPNYK